MSFLGGFNVAFWRILNNRYFLPERIWWYRHSALKNVCCNFKSQSRRLEWLLQDVVKSMRRNILCFILHLDWSQCASWNTVFCHRIEVVISDTESSWRPVPRGVPHGLVQLIHQWPGQRDRVYPQQVCWWPQAGRSGWYTGRLCCYSVRPGQAGELGREEPDEVQQGQVQGPAPGEE